VTPDNPIVFLVDDDPRVREALCSLISSVGLRVAAFVGSEFLAFEKPDAPSCLVLDLELPDVNGLELQRDHHRSPSGPDDAQDGRAIAGRAC
jgi:FixJ family two-component response regulator